MREAAYIDLAPILAPVSAPDNVLTIRMDRLGEGQFGAPRSGNRTHLGIDFEAPLSSAVMACKGGRVVRSENQPRGMGEHIVILHTDGTHSLYGHLEERLVAKGERVRQGQEIGRIGRTGNAGNPRMRPHLHFELWQNKQAVDPVSEEWLGKRYEVRHPPRPK